MAGYKKLLVLLDLSDDSEQVAVAGRDLAAYSNAAMVVLHVVEFVPVEPMGESLMPTVQIEDDLDQTLARLKLERAHRARLGLRSVPPGGSKPATPRRKFCASPTRKQPI